MTILVDPPLWPRYGRLWSHLVSDHSLEELHAFADLAGLPSRAFDLDHYDVPDERHTELVALGAVAVGTRELVLRLRASGLRVPARDRRLRALATSRSASTRVTIEERVTVARLAH